MASEANVDLLVLSALTEEQQVAHAVLQRQARRLGEHGDIPNRVMLYDFQADGETSYRIATACMHDMGVEAMSTFVTGLLSCGLRPSAAVLVGVAATVDRDDVDFGDVPVASQVYSAGDIEVKDGRFTFRTHGFQVDTRLKLAAGAIREDGSRHQKWRLECRSVVEHVVQALNENGLRSHAMLVPADLRLPRLVVEVGASGPFLLKDAEFARALRDGSATSGPVHPKLAWVEMEAHGFMKTCHMMNVPAIVMKGISDGGDAGKSCLEQESKGFFRGYACSNAVVAVLHLLQQRPWRPVPAARRLGARRKVLLNIVKGEDAAGAERFDADLEGHERPSTLGLGLQGQPHVTPDVELPPGSGPRAHARPKRVGGKSAKRLTVEAEFGHDRPGLLDRALTGTADPTLRDLAEYLWSVNPKLRPVLMLGDTLDTYVSPSDLHSRGSRASAFVDEVGSRADNTPTSSPRIRRTESRPKQDRSTHRGAAITTTDIKGPVCRW